MAYSIKTKSGDPIATVQDGTLNTVTTSLTLIGRDYAGYGAFLNENFVYLLENFASTETNKPTNPLTGQLWYDKTNKALKVWDTSQNQWKPISSSIATYPAPSVSISTIGDLWWDTTNFQLNVYGGPTAGTPNNWVLIGPPTTTTTGTTSGAAVDTIKDKSGYDHVVIKFYINNNIVGIVSYSDAFTPQTELAGFALINPGLNLTTLLSSTFTGDATNALKLNGVSSSSFLRSDQNTSTSYKLNADGGIAVANEFDITLDATNNQIAVKSSINNRNLNFYVNQNSNLTAAISIGASTGIVTINDAQEVQGALTTYGAFIANTTTTLVGTTTLKNSLLPSNSGTIDIGSTGTRFGNVWATNLIGNVTGSLTAVTISASGNVTVSGTVTIGGSLAATQSYVATYVQTATQNSQGQKTISTSAPAGGSNGDIWYQI